MLDSLLRSAGFPRASQGVTEAMLSVGVILGFLWLLIQDRVHPFVVYLTQLYLTL